MAYSYYQHSMPGWGTNQFQFIPPPAPTFQPQSTWGGYDFYQAHAVNADPSLYDHAWRHVREHHGRGYGVGVHDARHYHRRAYGSRGLSSLTPTEIGYAAAYEAYRTWIHNSSMYEPLAGDYERQREGLIGFAIAEATRLMHSMGRSLDSYGRTQAVDAAASTAANLFDESEDEDRYPGSRSRRGSHSGGYDPYDPYINDDPLMYRSRHRSHSHGRHRSYSQAMLLPPPGGQYPHSNSMAIPVVQGGGYGGQYPGYMSTSYPNQGMQMHGYGQSAYNQQPMMALPSTSYDGGHHYRERRNSVSVPLAYAPSQSSVPIVVPLASSSSSRKHKHRSSSTKRSRSSDPARRIEYPGFTGSGYAGSGY